MAIVGCTDCIVTLPLQPTSSMKFEVAISEGFNTVIKRVGTVVGYFPTNNLGTESVELVPGASYTWSAGFTSFCLGTNQPLQVTTAVGTALQTFNVRSVLLIDQAYTSVTISNPSTATQTAKVSMFFTQ